MKKILFLVCTFLIGLGGTFPNAQALSIQPLPDSANITEFGVVPGNKSSANVAIAGAIKKLCEHPSHGILFFPPGDYILDASAPLTVSCAGITIAGAPGGAQQEGGTRFLVVGSGTAPLFRFAAPFRPNDRYFYGGVIRDFAVRYTGNSMKEQNQRGPVVSFEHCAGCRAENIFVANAQNAFRMFAGFKNVFRGNFVTQIVPGGYGYTLTGDMSANNCKDIGGCQTRLDVAEIGDFHVDAALGNSIEPGNCIHVAGFVATVWVHHGTCNQTHTGLRIDCPTNLSHTFGACPQFIDLYRLEVESNATGDPLTSGCVDASDFAHFHAEALQCYGYGSPVNLLRFMNKSYHESNDIELVDPYIGNAQKDCILTNARGINLSGGEIFSCASAAKIPAESGKYAGIHLTVDHTSGALNGSSIIRGTSFCVDYGSSAPSKMTGVILEPQITYSVVMGNVLRHCAGTGVRSERSATNIIANNTPT